MKLTELFEKADKTLFSFEILPPIKGKSIQSIYRAIDPLIKFNPAYINVTYHREEYTYKKHPNGLLERISIRKRPGTVGICAAIKHKYGVEAVPHLICGGFTKDETENALVDLHYLGLSNVLVLRGDPMRSESTFMPEPGGHRYAIDLLKQVMNMNKGIYLHEEVKEGATDFCIGVAGYPEKHFESPNRQFDLRYLKQKVDAGASYIVTQLFYDNEAFIEFVKKCREAGIDVPIIPGIKPIAKLRHINFLPSFFHVSLPDELTAELEKCKDDKAAEQVGKEWAIKQCKELIDFGVPCLHFYTMGTSDVTRQIAEKIY